MVFIYREYYEIIWHSYDETRYQICIALNVKNYFEKLAALPRKHTSVYQLKKSFGSKALPEPMIEKQL